jgi:hypothetical protein
MANRLLRNDFRSFVPGLVVIAGKAILAADGSAGALTANGVTSFAKVSTGRFKLTLTDKWNAMIACQLQLAAAAVKGYSLELVSEDVASSKEIIFHVVKNGGTSSQPTFSGSALAGHSHTFTGSALATHAHDLKIIGGQAAAGTAALAWYATDILGKEAVDDKTILGADSATKGGVVALSAGTPAGTLDSVSGGTPAGTVSTPTITMAPAVTDLAAAATVYFQILLRNSSVSR